MTGWTNIGAERLAAQIWGLRGTAYLLASERDANYRFEPDDGGKPQVLKISHPDEDPAVAAYQTEALVHARLTDPTLPVPKVMPTASGHAWHRLDEDRPCIARMVGWLDGQPVAGAEISAAFRERLGALIARLNLALTGFDVVVPRQEFVWDLTQAASLRNLLGHVADPDARALAARALDHFADEIAPQLPGLRHQAIHNDMNPHNILVRADAPEEPAAIIDFGDMLHGPLIAELAIALAYQPVDPADPLGHVTVVTRGYHRVLPLQPAEIAVLPGLIATRRAASVVVSSWRAEMRPENRDYLLRNLAGAKNGLARFADLPPGAVLSGLQNACEPAE